MNINTGHLMNLKDAEVPIGYDMVPQHLLSEVAKELNGENEGYAQPGGKLSKWAYEKKKARNKMAKQSRKQNRRN